MSRRSRGRGDATKKAHAPHPAGRGQGPSIRRPAVPTGGGGAVPRHRNPWDDACPVCGADILEEGGTGCCGALIAECEGALNGSPVAWDDLTEAEEDAVSEQTVHHAWYLDKGEPAPSDYTTSSDRLPCRCEGRPHVHV